MLNINVDSNNVDKNGDKNVDKNGDKNVDVVCFCCSMSLSGIFYKLSRFIDSAK